MRWPRTISTESCKTLELLIIGAMAKKAAVGASGPVFPLGDPEGVVRWTPALLKKVFPRRELGLKAPKTEAPAAIVDDLRANAAAWWGHFEAGARVPGADASLHAALADARAWLDGDVTQRPSVELAALAFQLAVPGEMFRAESFAARLVDLWVVNFGVPFALDALAAAFTLAQAQGESMLAVSPTPKPRRGYGTGPTSTSVHANALTLIRGGHVDCRNLRVDEIADAAAGKRHLSIHFVNDECRAWLRLREHLAAAPEAAWRECLTRAEALMAQGDPLVCHLVAFSFPERPEWAESLTGQKGHSLFPVLSASVRDPSRLTYVALEYFFTEFERTAVSLLAAAGPRAVPALLQVLPRTRETPKQRYLYNLLAQVDTDEAVDALLDATKPAAQPAVAAMEANFPARVAARRAARG